MPDKVLWLDMIPSAIQQLQVYQPDELIGRGTVQILLSVEKRRATLIMREAGAQDSDMKGRDLMIRRIALQCYLENKGDPKAIRKERERFREFQRKLGEMRQSSIDNPPCRVEMPLAQARQMEKRGFAGLAQGISVGPGRIVVEFKTVQEAKEKLMNLALAMGKEPEEFEERTRLA